MSGLQSATEPSSQVVEPAGSSVRTEPQQTRLAAQSCSSRLWSRTPTWRLCSSWEGGGKVRTAKLPGTVTQTRQPAQRALQSSKGSEQWNLPKKSYVQISIKTFSSKNISTAEVNQGGSWWRWPGYILGHPCQGRVRRCIAGKAGFAKTACRQRQPGAQPPLGRNWVKSCAAAADTFVLLCIVSPTWDLLRQIPHTFYTRSTEIGQVPTTFSH